MRKGTRRRRGQRAGRRNLLVEERHGWVEGGEKESVEGAIDSASHEYRIVITLRVVPRLVHTLCLAATPFGKESCITSSPLIKRRAVDKTEKRTTSVNCLIEATSEGSVL